MPLRGPFFLWNPTEKSAEELEQTFVPVDGVLRRIERDLREQSDLGQVTHFLMIGQRGTGKTTHLALLHERFRAELNSPYYPIFLREEHPGIYGLLGLYEHILEQLAQNYSVTAASRALNAMRRETEEALALALAESALRQHWRDTHKRVLLLFDHFNEFVESQLLHDAGDWRLRALLQLNTPMVLVAASPIALHEMMEPFSDSSYIGRRDEMHRDAEQYENAFFQFFLPFYLRPLDGAGVRDLIETRARWDGEEGFWQRHQARIQAITTLTGGNPRLVMALYRLLAEGDIASAADDLRQLLDLLSEYFRDRWKDLPKQEQRVIHALIESGVETAPGAIAKQARLSPNVTSKLLERLAHSGLIAYQQKGPRSRLYMLNDRLFSMWYQMRFIKPLGQRLMGLVETLQLLFSPDERERWLEYLQAATQAAFEQHGKSGLKDKEIIWRYVADIAITGDPDTARVLQEMILALIENCHPEEAIKLLNALQEAHAVNLSQQLEALRPVAAFAAGDHEALTHVRLEAREAVTTLLTNLGYKPTAPM